MNFLEQTSFREATPKGPDFFRSAELDSVDPKSGIPSTIQHCAPSHNKLHYINQKPIKMLQSCKVCFLRPNKPVALCMPFCWICARCKAGKGKGLRGRCVACAEKLRAVSCFATFAGSLTKNPGQAITIVPM